MSSEIFKSEFTDVGELVDLPNGGLAILLTFGPALRRVVKHMRGKQLLVTFTEAKYQRSSAQNRYLWGVIYTTIKAWYKETQGESISKEHLHAHTLSNVLESRIEITEIFGEEVFIVKQKSTSQLTAEEFGDMVEKLKAFWAEKGCVIPDSKQFNILSEYLHLKDK